MKCPKCGYARNAVETAPEWQCPSCGVAYAKASANGVAPVRLEPRQASGGGWIGKFLFVAALAIGGLAALHATRQPVEPVRQGDVSGASVIMYSLTTCGYCNQKRAQLKAQGIPFTEYFVDRDQARQQELFRKLEAAGYRGGGIGTPTFEVNGKMLPNNPSMETIVQHL